MEWEPFNKPKPLLVNMSYTQFTGEITQGVSWYYSLPLPIRGGYKKATLVSVHFKNIYTGSILASIGIEIKELPKNVVRDAYNGVKAVPNFVVPNRTWASTPVQCFWDNYGAKLENATVHLDENITDIDTLTLRLWDGTQAPLVTAAPPPTYFCDIALLFE